MLFFVGKDDISSREKGRFILSHNSWNDWWTYENEYTLNYVQKDGTLFLIGSVKIGQIDSTNIPSVPEIPTHFDSLSSDKYISLGQDEDYYDNLNSLGVILRQKVLNALNDIALNLDVFERFKNYSVVTRSLTRFIPPTMVKNQLHRMANGGARLTDYHFKYVYPEDTYLALTFSIEPESYPPTNIHVIIGRNGVGKTWLLKDMIKASYSSTESCGNIEFENGDSGFSNIVCLAFSAFDEFPLSNDSASLRYSYIGIKSIVDGNELSLDQQFSRSLTTCMTNRSRYERWKRAMSTLNSDPIFSSVNLVSMVENIQNNRTDYPRHIAEDEIQKTFNRLSSGHKIVALTITRLVETVEERTLVLLDEPELHLHPPLLAAFTRALSDLLIDRNGVAIVSTHSPVVLQEVPKSCVWILHRSGRAIAAYRPQIETFGENVGILTSEVFGLEVSKSGFHQMIEDALVENNGNYDLAYNKFQGQLGAEALGILSVSAYQMGDGNK